jgi:hypothetical protein
MLLFLYKELLGRELTSLDSMQRAFSFFSIPIGVE